MKKRNLYGEIVEGFDAMASVRAGKHILRTHEGVLERAPDVAAEAPLALPAHPYFSRMKKRICRRSDAASTRGG